MIFLVKSLNRNMENDKGFFSKGKYALYSLNRYLISFVKYLFAWVVVVPISFTTYKKNIVFIGRDNGRFVDNTKYLFLYALDKNEFKHHKYFLTEDKKTYIELASKNIPVLLYPSIKSFFILLTTKVVVVDSERWIGRIKYHYLFNAKRLQLWHAVPTKKIGLATRNTLIENGEYSTKDKILDAFRGAYCKYDIFNSTSDYLINSIFSKAFIANSYVNFGYPRNDMLFSKDNLKNMISTDRESIERIFLSKSNKSKIILYAPTFRKSGEAKYIPLKISQLNGFCKNNNLFLIIKHHYRPNHNMSFTKQDLSNIVYYDNECDVYPVLKIIDLIITDYSSIYIDTLLINKKVIFFPFDINEYYTNTKDKLDYLNKTPGPKCFDQSELQREIINMLHTSKDKYSDERTNMRNISFDRMSAGASEQLWDCINDL